MIIIVQYKKQQAQRNWSFIIKKHIQEGRDDNGLADKISTMPLHLGSFNLWHSKRSRNNVIRHIGGSYNKNVYYTDTDSIYNHKKEWDKLQEGECFQDGFRYGKNDYGDCSGILKALFLAPNVKYCLVIDSNRLLTEIFFTGLDERSFNVNFEDFVNLSRGGVLEKNV